jgi:NADH-quinone oxidoreductase B subunit
MMAAGGADFDLARYGMEVFRNSPRQADLMIVAGRVSQKMAPVLRQVYDQMMEPKWVISMGVCASTGGMFNNYAIVQGVDQIVPVDVYAPGCPPSPETLMHAILTLHEQIRTGEIMKRRSEGRPTHVADREPLDSRGPRRGEGGNAEVIPLPPTAPPGVVTSRRSGRGPGCFPTRDAVRRARASFKDDHFEMCVDLCAVDYLEHLTRPLPDGVKPTRFEVVVNLLSLSKRQRVRIRVQAGDDEPRVPRSFISIRELKPWSAKCSTSLACSSTDTPT